jgi:hypothetical protein
VGQLGGGAEEEWEQRGEADAGDEQTASCGDRGGQRRGHQDAPDGDGGAAASRRLDAETISDAVTDQTADEHPAGRGDEAEAGLAVGDVEAIVHHQCRPVVRW